MFVLLLETGGTDNLLLETADNLLKEDSGAVSGRLARACALDGLGGAGQQAFNPSLAGV